MAGFDDRARQQRLVQHCNADKVVFAMHGGVKYQRKAEVFKTQASVEAQLIWLALRNEKAPVHG